MDILDDFDEIKIGVAYRLNGEVLESMPGGCVGPSPFNEPQMIVVVHS